MSRARGRRGRAVRPVRHYGEQRGITRDATLRKMTEDEFDQVISVHLKGTWNGPAQGSLDHARAEERRHREHVLDLGQGRLIGTDQLLRSQGRIVGMTKAASKELAHLGVSVNAIQPGDPFRHDRGHAATYLGLQRAEVPMGRAGSRRRWPRWPCSWRPTLSSYMTGTSSRSPEGGTLMRTAVILRARCAPRSADTAGCFSR